VTRGVLSSIFHFFPSLLSGISLQIEGSWGEVCASQSRRHSLLVAVKVQLLISQQSDPTAPCVPSEKHIRVEWMQ